jgi:hypothetical protein
VRIEHEGAGRMLHCRTVEDLSQITIHASDFELMPTIPSKFREYNFQSLAQYWAAALNAFPKAVNVKPENISTETLVRKLRESRVAKEQYHWTHPSVDEVLWTQHAKDLVISPLLDGTVSIGSVNATEPVAFEGALTSRNDFCIEWKNKETLETFCNLVSQKVFAPKPSFIIFGLDSNTIADLENRYDVGFFPREDGKSHNVIF